MMKKIIALLFVLALTGCGREAADGVADPAMFAGPDRLISPNHKLEVRVFVTERNTLAYTVARRGQPVLLESSLGLQLTGADFTRDVQFRGRSAVTSIEDEYTLRVGKKSRIA
jgi:hypothetical protein